MVALELPGCYQKVLKEIEDFVRDFEIAYSCPHIQLPSWLVTSLRVSKWRSSSHSWPARQRQRPRASLPCRSWMRTQSSAEPFVKLVCSFPSQDSSRVARIMNELVGVATNFHFVLDGAYSPMASLRSWYPTPACLRRLEWVGTIGIPSGQGHLSSSSGGWSRVPFWLCWHPDGPTSSTRSPPVRLHTFLGWHCDSDDEVWIWNFAVYVSVWFLCILIRYIWAGYRFTRDIHLPKQDPPLLGFGFPWRPMGCRKGAIISPGGQVAKSIASNIPSSNDNQWFIEILNSNMTLGSFSMGFWLNPHLSRWTYPPNIPDLPLVLVYLPTFWVHFYGDKVGPSDQNGLLNRINCLTNGSLEL